MLINDMINLEPDKQVLAGINTGFPVNTRFPVASVIQLFKIKSYSFIYISY